MIFTFFLLWEFFFLKTIIVSYNKSSTTPSWDNLQFWNCVFILNHKHATVEFFLIVLLFALVVQCIMFNNLYEMIIIWLCWWAWILRLKCLMHFSAGFVIDLLISSQDTRPLTVLPCYFVFAFSFFFLLEVEFCLIGLNMIDYHLLKKSLFMKDIIIWLYDYMYLKEEVWMLLYLPEPYCIHFLTPRNVIINFITIFRIWQNIDEVRWLKHHYFMLDWNVTHLHFYHLII